MARENTRTVEDAERTPSDSSEREPRAGRVVEQQRDLNTHLLLLAWSRLLRNRQPEALRSRAAR